MTYQQAKRKIYSRFFIGVIILFIASVSTIISILKMFYFGIYANTLHSSDLATFLQKAIDYIYRNTQHLSYFWTHSPLPIPKNIWSHENLYFLMGYMCILVGLAYISSARTLHKRLVFIDQKVERELIIAAVIGKNKRDKKDIRKAIPIQYPKLFSHFHKLYFAPVFAGIMVMLTANSIGLT